MKRTLAVLVALCVGAPLFAQTKSRYLIAMRRPAGVSALRLVQDAAEIMAHNVRTFANIDFAAADLTEAEAAALRTSSDVRYVSPVVPRSIEAIDPRPPARLLKPVVETLSSQNQVVPYGIDLVHARDVWPFTRGGNGRINVVILDTGIDYTHPDVKDRYMGGFNVFTNTNDPMDDHGHGTHVAGIIGATDNSFGVVGVAPEAHIWSAKVLKADGTGTDETVIAGMDWVISKKHEIGGNWIVNLSLGSTTPSDPERAMFAQAIEEGIVVVAAAGNLSVADLEFPAGYDRVIAVSAIDANSNLADFSSYGDGVGFAAPGVDVLSTFRTGVIESAEVDVDTSILSGADPLNGSGKGEVTAATVACGLGRPEDIPASVAGKIALITRGEIQFKEKVKNALSAGAAAMVIVPPVDDSTRPNWSLIVDNSDIAFKFPVVVSVAAQDGANLIANAGGVITVAYIGYDYTRLSGTSMATPHVVGTTALVWSLAPDATAEQIRLAMKLSAFDLGPQGYDDTFGYGRIDALAAAKYVAPSLFGLPPTKDPVPTRTRPSSPHN